MLSGTGEPVPFQEERLFGELNRGCIFENVPQELRPSSVALLFGTGEPVPFREERLFGQLRLTAEVFLLRRHSAGAIKNPAVAGCWIKLILDRERV